MSMLVEHIRKFMPVGHGAFFLERLLYEGQRILPAVYDCGDSNSGHEVEKFALQEFGATDNEEREKVDILFISHFDDDHVNGLTYLQPYLKQNTRVFLPFYYEHLRDVYDRNKRAGITTVISILNQIGIKPILVQYAGTDVQGDGVDVDEYDYEAANHTIYSGQPITKTIQGQPIWRYVPFNLFNEQEYYQDFQNKVKNSLHWTDAKLMDVANWTQQDIKALRGVYNSFTGTTINDNSLIVLSDKPKGHRLGRYDTIQAVFLQHTRTCVCFRFSGCCGISCLYTGDTVLRRGVRKTSKYVDRYEDFLKNLKRHVEFISLMQIPHHGSGSNSNIASLCDCMSGRLFCNYATVDSHKAISILNSSKLETIWKNVYSITEDDKTMFEEHGYYRMPWI